MDDIDQLLYLKFQNLRQVKQVTEYQNKYITRNFLKASLSDFDQQITSTLTNINLLVLENNCYKNQHCPKDT